MWSISSNNHTTHVGTYASETAAYIARHRYLFVTLAVVLALCIMASVFFLQNAAASQKAHTETSLTHQGPVTSAADVNVHTQPQPASVAEQPTTQPTQTQASASQSNTDTKVHINGEAVTVPPNGSVHRTIQDDNGTTNVDVSVHANTSGTTTSVSSSSVSSSVTATNQSSQSSVSINNSQ